MKKFQPDKLKPKSEKCIFIGYPKEKCWVHLPEKEFISKEVSGRKVELDVVIAPSLELESSSSQKSVLVMPTPTREEANDNDHETLDQLTTEPRRSTRARSAPEWYGNTVLEVMLLSTKLELSQKCFRQVQDVEHNEIFSLVSMLKSLSESC